MGERNQSTTFADRVRNLSKGAGEVFSAGFNTAMFLALGSSEERQKEARHQLELINNRIIRLEKAFARASLERRRVLAERELTSAQARRLTLERRIAFLVSRKQRSQ